MPTHVITTSLAIALLMLASIVAAAPEKVPDGAAIFAQRCSICHDHPHDQIPPKIVLGFHPREYIVHALTEGPMQAQASGLSTQDIDAVANYLVASQDQASFHGPRLAEPQLFANVCKAPAPSFTLDADSWNGWSPDLGNGRLQPRPGLEAADIPKLKPKWVFAYPAAQAYGTPSVIGGRVFVGSVNGSVLSLDAKSGCTYWATPPGGPAVRSAISVGPWLPGNQTRFAAYFGDAKAVVHAVDAETGKSLWSTRVDDHAFAAIGGAPTLHEGRLYVPVAAMEGLISGVLPTYPCCSLRGSMVVLAALTGKVIWKAYTVNEEPKPYKINSAGTQMYGPAGASIWSPPTLDLKAGAVYGTTGESPVDVKTDAADAIIAFDLHTGARRWLVQGTTNDYFSLGCDIAKPGPNCPAVLGQDADFASPAILRSLANGKRILVGAQKSGAVLALDPDAAGKLLWRADLSKGAGMPPGVVLRDLDLPGVSFGMAADDRRLYAATADRNAKPGHIPLGVYALDLYTGKVVWHAPGAPVPSCSWGKVGCNGAQRTAVSLIPGVAFAGSANGHIRAYAAADGKVIWDFDTARSYAAVNGVKARGGAIAGTAVAVSGGTVYVMSGYGGGEGGGVGDALIAFTVNGQ